MENYIIANKTDVGMARQVNEDSMITFDSPNGRIVAVCDGMGGQAAGDVASQLACSIIRDILENNTFATPQEAITCSIMAANQGILHRASQNPELSGMGATCVMLIIKDGLVYYGWVGDSRIYYVCNHIISQISKDQSYVQTLVDQGLISAEEAEHHPQKNEITNALGVEGMTPPVLCQMPINPEAGSIFLLCSDGLTGMVDNTHIEHIISREGLSLQEKADALVQMANANGGLDNITVQLVQFPNGQSSSAGTSKGGKVWKKILIAVFALLLVASGAVGSYIYFSSKDKKDEKKEEMKTEQKSDSVKTPEKKEEQGGIRPSTAPAKGVRAKEIIENGSKVNTTPTQKVKDEKNGEKTSSTKNATEKITKPSNPSGKSEIVKEANNSTVKKLLKDNATSPDKNDKTKPVNNTNGKVEIGNY